MRTRTSLISLVLLALVGCSSVPPVGESPADVATASTPSEHRRIADFFSRKAINYDAEAALHERMAISYATRPKGDVQAMVAHCRSLRDHLLAAAKDARDLEREHRLLAAEPNK